MSVVMSTKFEKKDIKNLQCCDVKIIHFYVFKSATTSKFEKKEGRNIEVINHILFAIDTLSDRPLD
jgi:hypothetical protein